MNGIDIEALKKSLEASNYNAAPLPFIWGDGETKCICGKSQIAKYKLGHKPSCPHWVFYEQCALDNRFVIKYDAASWNQLPKNL